MTKLSTKTLGSDQQTPDAQTPDAQSPDAQAPQPLPLDRLSAETVEFVDDFAQVAGNIYMPLFTLKSWYQRIAAMDEEARTPIIAGIVVIARRLERNAPGRCSFAIAQILSLLEALLGDEQVAKDMLDQVGVDADKARAMVSAGQAPIQFEARDAGPVVGGGLLGILNKK